MGEKTLKREDIKKHLAIVILAFSDYESLELALASHARFTVNSGVPIFVLQNGNGTYDTERTCSVGKRYQALFPETIKVVTHIPPQRPYSAIKQLFKDDLMEDYKYIIKLDDDVMVVSDGWVDKLIDCYCDSYDRFGDDLAYVTSLVNNNPFGFKKLIDLCDDLSEEYYSRLARVHIIGNGPDDSYNPYRIVSKETIYDGGFGTIWRLPYLARWIHSKTTLSPEDYVNRTKVFGVSEVDSRKRYSINCMLFEKQLWEDMADGGLDDEHMLHAYCMLKKKKIIADLSIPMVHIAFYSQREEIRDLIPEIRKVYTQYLDLPFPIAICNDKMVEIENRLRYIERTGINSRYGGDPGKRGLKWFASKVRGGIRCYKEHGFKYTYNRFLFHLGLKSE